jgi:hypothetical protein
MSFRTEQKKVSWRVGSDSLDAIDKAMQERLPRDERTYQALLDQLVTSWLNQQAPPSPPPGKDYELPPHRQELVERFLAWWDGDRSEIGLAVKVAVSKLAGVPWIQPEIDAQKQRKR